MNHAGLLLVMEHQVRALIRLSKHSSPDNSSSEEAISKLWRKARHSCTRQR